jgi:hypothetical protein
MINNSAPRRNTSAGLTVKRHDEHFASDTLEEVWLEEIGKRGWIALSHDRRIRYKPNESNAVLHHGVGLLLIIGKAPFAELAKAFVNTVPAIEGFLRRHKPPFIAKVFRPSPAETARRKDAPGRVERWYPVS